MKCDECGAEGRRLSRVQGSKEFLCPQCRGEVFRLIQPDPDAYYKSLYRRTSVSPQTMPEAHEVYDT
jgi:DNA-directed RNA polymerase subunit RPC12/RpoP